MLDAGISVPCGANDAAVDGFQGQDHDRPLLWIGVVMHLQQVSVFPSPRTAGYQRAAGVVIFDNGEKLEIWVDVPADLAGDLSENGNPWVVAMLPMAASRHENIRVSLPIDLFLVENLQAASRVWAGWYKHLSEVKIEGPAYSASNTPRGKKSAAFFSGGVDSYFTIARRLPSNTYGLPVIGEFDELISVWGFDVSVHDEVGFHVLDQHLVAAAAEIGRRHFLIHTNLRDNNTVLMKEWGPLAHGAGIAFISLLLEKRYDRVFFGSSYPVEKQFPWGSHSVVDALFSTLNLDIVNDGASTTRVLKTDTVAKYPPAQSMLHVCQAVAENNCSECEKCYRTMIALDILGHKEAMSKAFDWSKYKTSAIRSLSVMSAGDRVFYEELLVAASDAHRDDIVQELNKAVARSNLRYPFLKIGKSLMRLPLLWRLGDLFIKIAKYKTIDAKYIAHQKNSLSPMGGATE